MSFKCKKITGGICAMVTGTLQNSLNKCCFPSTSSLLLSVLSVQHILPIPTVPNPIHLWALTPFLQLSPHGTRQLNYLNPYSPLLSQSQNDPSSTVGFISEVLFRPFSDKDLVSIFPSTFHVVGAPQMSVEEINRCTRNNCNPNSFFLLSTSFPVSFKLSNQILLRKRGVQKKLGSVPENSFAKAKKIFTVLVFSEKVMLVLLLLIF